MFVLFVIQNADISRCFSKKAAAEAFRALRADEKYQSLLKAHKANRQAESALALAVYLVKKSPSDADRWFKE